VRKYCRYGGNLIAQRDRLFCTELAGLRPVTPMSDKAGPGRFRRAGRVAWGAVPGGAPAWPGMGQAQGAQGRTSA
jgi:hypothetical protein